MPGVSGKTVLVQCVAYQVISIFTYAVLLYHACQSLRYHYPQEVLGLTTDSLSPFGVGISYEPESYHFPIHKRQDWRDNNIR